MPDFAKNQTLGGQAITAVAAGSGAADVVVSSKPGRVNHIVVTTAGTAVLKLYDHASASSGAKLIWSSAATPAVGDVLKLDIPVDNGIVALQANGSAAVTISYTVDGTAGAGKDNAEPVTAGGQRTSYHAAGASGAGAALAAQGRLCKISVLTSGSAATLIYDNASAASGTLLYSLKASPTIGDVIDLQIPASNGIYVAGATNTSSILVTYSKKTAYNR